MTDEFSRKDALRKHERRFHDDNVEKYKCPHCKYQSKMSGDMRKHISVVSSVFLSNGKTYWNIGLFGMWIG